MKEKERIVVTGMGAVTPVGIGTDEYWNGLVSGSCGIGRISAFDASDLAVQIAAEVRTMRMGARNAQRTIQAGARRSPENMGSSRRPRIAAASSWGQLCPGSIPSRRLRRS